MFQLTSPLIPAPVRAGIAGVSVGGGVTTGGKTAIDLPDFMTFALIGAAPAQPGKARQDPAGGGEAVPGGASFVPPAGHPAKGADVLPTLVTAPAGSTGGEVADQAVGSAVIRSSAPKVRGGKQTATTRIQDRLTSKSEMAATVPYASAAPATATPVAGKRAKVQQDDVRDATPEVAAPPADANAMIQPPSPIMLSVARSGAADDRLPAARPVDGKLSAATPANVAAGIPAKPAVLPNLTDGADLPVQSASGPVTSAIAHPAPLAPVAATGNPASLATIAVVGDAARPTGIAAPADPDSPAMIATIGAVAQPASIAAIADPAPLATITAIADFDPARSRPSQNVSTGIATPLSPPTIVSAPATAAVLAPSLVPIARMLDASYRDTSFAVGAGRAVGTGPSQAANLPASAVVALPAMPASVASFLASVGPRPVAFPLADIAPRTLALRGQSAAGILATPASPTNVGPAGQLFAEAIHAAAGSSERSSHGDPASALAITQPAANAPSAPIAAVTDRAPIDITQGHWPAKMIERIESLRDAVDAQDTRIKLIPDALGAIDIAMKRDGDTVHVHLAAERPETRAIIADAQPRLAELGEQRGLKIAASSGQSSGQASAQDFHQPRGQPAPQQQPARPASARASDQSDHDDDGDQRLA